MYYGLIFVSVLMFGGTFALNDVYRSKVGSGIKVSVQFTLMTSIPGLIALFIINGLKVEFTWFTFIMSLIHCASGFCMTFCGFKALEKINLSLYSLFMMLGGMLLPYFQGILFYDEPLTGAKIICFVIICIALLLTIEKGSGLKKSGFIYYAVIFVLNGMSGVMSKYFTEAPFEKTSPAGYSILSAIISIVTAAILTLVFMNHGPKIKHTPLTVAIASGNGVLNRVANLILVITLANGVDSSIQYSIVTGGVIVVSTAAAFLGANKPSRREVISALLACLGIAALLLPF